jgi:hypothetical protein
MSLGLLIVVSTFVVPVVVSSVELPFVKLLLRSPGQLAGRWPRVSVTRQSCASTDACLIKKRGAAHTELLQTETKFKTKRWSGIGEPSKTAVFARIAPLPAAPALARWRRLVGGGRRSE